MTTPQAHEAEIDALYQLPPAEFVAARTALAKKLGRGPAASEVKELPKPLASAWIINRLGAEHPTHFAALLRAGESLRRANAEAMSSADAASLREATESQRRAVQTLVDDAEALLRDAGQRTDGDTLPRARESLRAISTRGNFGDQRAGRLVRDVPYPDFVELLAGVAAPPMAPAKKAALAPEHPASAPPPRAHSHEKDDGAKARERAEAEREKERAKEADIARKAAEKRERLERELALEKSRARAEEAKRVVSSARKDAQHAHAAVAEAKRTLTKAEDGLAAAERVLVDAERDAEEANEALRLAEG